jgi:hypothetical protein
MAKKKGLEASKEVMSQAQPKTDQFGKTPQDYAGITKILSRPTGTQQGANIDVTNLSPIDRERVQLANSLISQDINAQKLQQTKDIISQNIQNQPISQPQQQQEQPSGAKTFGQLEQEYSQSQQQKTQQLTSDLATAGQDMNLNPSQSTIGQVPILGATSETLGKVFGGVEQEQPLKQEGFDYIEKKVFKKGVDMNTKLGAVIESLPIIGGINRYFGNLVNTPADQIDDLSSMLTPLRKQVIKYQTIAKQNPSSRIDALNNVIDAEYKIQEIESKIRLTSQYSAEARANPEKLDIIELNLKNTRLDLARVKFNIQNGIDESGLMLSDLMQ